jgi:hypothetical protein
VSFINILTSDGRAFDYIYNKLDEDHYYQPGQSKKKFLNMGLKDLPNMKLKFSCYDAIVDHLVTKSPITYTIVDINSENCEKLVNTNGLLKSTF